MKKRGAVLDSLDLTGPVVIAAADVVIRRSRISGTGHYGVIVRSGSVRIEDTEISGFANGIAFNNWTALRVNVHSVTEDGFKIGSNVLLQDSWCHDLTPAPGAHADCGQMQNGVVNTVIRGNSLDPATGDSLGNAALFLVPTLGPDAAGPLTVTGNLLGGGNYSLYCVDGDPYVVAKISIEANTFKRNARYGPHVTNVPVTWRANSWLDDGTPVGL